MPLDQNWCVEQLLSRERAAVALPRQAFLWQTFTFKIKDVLGPPEVADRARTVLRPTENAHLLAFETCPGESGKQQSI